MKILVTGASGLIGRHLIRHLRKDGHEVAALVRSPENFFECPRKQIFIWNSSLPPPLEALRNAEAVVNLAGESIAKLPWTSQQIAKIRSSRIEATKTLVKSIETLAPVERPKVLLNASAIGFYGDAGEETCTETSPPGRGFLAELCKEWESEALKAESCGLRVVLLRTGMVLSKDGGALEKMAPVSFGSGQQWQSWIHIEDLVRLISFAIQKSEIRGALNLTSPEPVRNRNFTRFWSRKRGWPMAIPAPAFLLKFFAGKFAKEVLLPSQRIFPEKAAAFPFSFQYKNLGAALDEIYGNQSLLDGKFHAGQFVARSRKEVFSFFSAAENLEAITPPWLNFRILGKSTPEIRENTLIDYKLRIHGVPVRWRTKISKWNPESSFVDEQLKGPYKKWHHLHRFEEVPGGTYILDEVTYRIPGSWIGRALLYWWIRKDINMIFDFRKLKIRELFPEEKSP